MNLRAFGHADDAEVMGRAGDASVDAIQAAAGDCIEARTYLNQVYNQVGRECIPTGVQRRRFNQAEPILTGHRIHA